MSKTQVKFRTKNNLKQVHKQGKRHQVNRKFTASLNGQVIHTRYIQAIYNIYIHMLQTYRTFSAQQKNQIHGRQP